MIIAKLLVIIMVKAVVILLECYYIFTNVHASHNWLIANEASNIYFNDFDNIVS